MDPNDFADVEIPSCDEVEVDRFVFLDDNDWPNLVECKLSSGTMRKLRFVESMFNEWRRHRILAFPNVTMPQSNIEDFTIDELNQWLPFFIAETRRKDGTPYRAKSIFEFILCLQSLIVVKKSVRHRFLKDDIFLPVRNSLDNIMKVRQSEGLGNNPKKAEIISEMMEEELWNSGLLGAKSPMQLVRTLVYILGVNLGLRAGEHRKLRRDMFEVGLSTLNHIIKHESICFPDFFCAGRCKPSVFLFHRMVQQNKPWRNSQRF